MKIDKISLFNFGSYEGLTEFDTKIQDDRNIILIGGKNGAGKTTLFTAMRLCLYGFMSMGYKNINSFYNRSIIKLINNNAKLKKPAIAYVQINLSLANGQGLDFYELKRSWILTDNISETFIVIKNGVELSQSETADFEKYILSLIPPELFNLYFFDGEKIADFFMNEGSNTRIKDAFLTLCGYDTFDIMRKNFKRVSSDNQSVGSLNNYVSAKENYEVAKNELTISEQALSICKSDLDTCESDLVALEKNYSKKGGITQEELNEKILQLKEEEKKRENWNTILKRWANDIIPFVMVKDQIEEVKRQINSENDYLKYKNFCEILESESILAILNNQNLSLDLVESTAKKEYGNNNNHILDLSLEQSSALLSQLNTILNFNAEKIVKCKTLIKRSLKIAAQIRKELENSSVDSVQEYMKNRAALLEKKSLLLNNQIELEQELQAKSDREIQTEGEFKKAQVILEEELKRASINDIAAKSIVMLDKLQAILYHKQISRVESFFRKEISTLMRKTNFIDDIHIDDDFNIHIYRNETISFSKILETVYSNSQDQLISLFGEAAINKIMLAAPSGNIFDAMEQLKMRRITALVLPIEIDKTSLSNGEKQIFIMAVYHSLVQLCTHDIPFIIDTPFARIDTEHRKNISKYFFSKLNGQVFILSTNEEINSEHVKIMKNKILATYMLENTDNKRTLVEKNTYFEG